MPASAADLGTLPQSEAVGATLYLAPAPDRAAALKQYLTSVQTPGDPLYRSWLTPAQFGQKFGATADQTARVTAWAQANGLAATVSASGLRVSLSGTAAQMETALAPGLHSVQLAGTVYTVNTAAPALAPSVVNDVLTVDGLSTLPSSHPMTVASAAGSAAADDPLAALGTVVDANGSRVVSMSGANCVGDFDAPSQAAMHLLLQQASVQGITMLATSGCGARGASAFPAMYAEVTAVAAAPGITVPANATLTEARPSWQSAAGLPADNFRHEPDLTASDFAALTRTVNSIVASFPATADGTPARLGNINATLYAMGPMKGLYTQPDNAPAGTWEPATGLGLVDLDKLAQFFPHGTLGVNVSIDVPPYYAPHGSAFTFTSVVKDVSGQGGGVAPSGTVTFTLTGGSLGKVTLPPVTLSNGTATLSYNQLPGGTYQASATYSGDGTYATGSSGTETVTVAAEQISPTATPAVSSTPLGGTISLLVTLKPPSGIGTPTSNVTVQPKGTPDTNTYTKAVSGSGGVATATVLMPAVQAGSDTFLVTCDNSDPSFSCAQPQVAITVGKVTPAVKLTVSGLTSSSVTLSATVVGAGNGALAPGGNVTFYNNGNKIQPATLDGNGQVSITPTNFFYSATANNFTVVYDGDNNYNGNSSTNTPTGAIATTTVASASATSVPIGGTVTLIATVSPATTSSSTMGGTVTFTNGGSITFCSGPVTSGVGSCTATFTARGISGIIVANYSGDANFAASSSTNNLQIQTVPGNTATAIVASPATPVAGQATIFTATVTATNGSSGSVPITGQVAFSVNNTVVASQPITSGQATYSTTLANGTDTVSAAYSGDSNWNGSQSPTLTYNIGTSGSGSASTIVLTTNTDFAVAGTNIIMTATITQPAGSTSSAPLSGSVTFYDMYNSQTIPLGTVNTTSSGPAVGVAQFSSTGLKQGTHLLYAVYSGNGTYSSQTSATHTVVLSDYSVTFSPQSITLVAGSSASSTATVNGLSSFGGTVKLACVPPSGVGITCNFSPSSIGAGATSSLTVTTQTLSKVDNHPLLLRGVAGGVAFAALLFGFVLPGRRKRMPVLSILLGLLLSAAAFGTLGCTNLVNAGGGGGSTQTGTPSGTYNLTISSAGTDAGGTQVTHSQNFVVVVQ
ncbi:MAG TPA: Ig-like domain repeat protein [Acidobacteriaceae bacterium]